MPRIVTLLSLASHRAAVFVHHVRPAVSVVPPVHPSAGLLLVIVIAIVCVMVVMRLVSFVFVTVVSQLAQIAAEVFGRILMLFAVIAVLVALVLAHI
jgi:hypothetical protein